MSVYGTSLYFFTSLLLGFVGGLIFLKDWKSFANRSLLVFVLSMIGYMASIYLGYHFVSEVDATLSTFFIRLAFFFGIFMTFSLGSFAYFYPKKTLNAAPFVERLFLLGTVSMGLFSALTPFVYEAEVIIDGQLVADIHGPCHGLLLFHYLFNCALAVYVSFVKLRKARSIERKKISLSLIGILIVVFTIVTFHAILPKFNIYLLQQEVVLFSLVFVILVFYSIVKYRFLSIKFIITQGLKRITAFLFALTATNAILILLEYALGDLIIFHINVTILFSGGLILFFYHLFSKLFDSDKFHLFFGTSNVEYFQKVLREFRTRQKEYHTLRSFKTDLKKIFSEKLRISDAKIIFLDKSSRKKFPHLISFLNENREILVTKECVFKNERNETSPIFLSELSSAGEVCLPLYRSSKSLFALFILGKKAFDDDYSYQEISYIEKLQIFMSLKLVGILYNEQLQSEVAEKTKALAQKNEELALSYEKLQDLDKLKDEFISIASHELRTPMAVMKGYADFLLSGDFGDLSAAQRKPIEKIYENAQELIELVNKILDISRIEADKLEFLFEKFSLVSFIDDIVSGFQIICSQRNIELNFVHKISKTDDVFIDKDHVKRILQNILGNAYKFTPDGGKIDVYLEVYSKNEKFYQISICDTGGGVPKSKRKHIFEKFYQIRNPDQEFATGTGLGLPIVKGIIQKLGGKIWLEDRSGYGACFCFIIPREAQKNEE